MKAVMLPAGIDASPNTVTDSATGRVSNDE